MIKKEVIENAISKANGDLKIAAQILNIKYNKLYYNVLNSSSFYERLF